jgi:hypothetical protein
MLLRGLGGACSVLPLPQLRSDVELLLRYIDHRASRVSFSAPLMTLPNWQPPEKKIPSELYLGEREKDALHTRVGSAIDEWETLESALARIFAHLVQSESLAAVRAYGTSGRKEALEVAAIEFFRGKSDPMMADFYELFSAYGAAAQYRNNIAHGICYGRVYLGGKGAPATWFLYPPHYNTRKRREGIKEADASYIYNAADILHCETRFKQLSDAANVLEDYLRKTYPLS